MRRNSTLLALFSMESFRRIYFNHMKKYLLISSLRFTIKLCYPKYYETVPSVKVIGPNIVPVSSSLLLPSDFFPSCENTMASLHFKKITRCLLFRHCCLNNLKEYDRWNLRNVMNLLLTPYQLLQHFLKMFLSQK